MAIFCNIKQCSWSDYIQRFDERICTKGYIVINKHGECEAASKLTMKKKEVKDDTKL